MADGSPAASPITTAPSDDPERPLLLFCPEQGGWQMGVFFDGRWLDFATLTMELEPTHWMDVPPIPRPWKHGRRLPDAHRRGRPR
jgi:hypothetical protein